MAQARGRKGHLLLDFESTFGENPGSPAAIKMPFQTSEVRSSQTLNEDQTIRDSRSPAKPTQGNIDVSGSIVVPVDSIGIGYWLKSMFDDPSTSGAGPYDHVFTLGDNQPSLVIEQGFNDISVYERFNGCRISTFSMELGGEGDVTASIDVMGAEETVDASTYDGSPTEITLKKFNQFQASIEEDGSTIAIVTQASIDIDFALDGDQYTLGNEGQRKDIPEGIAAITGNITALFENSTLLNKAIEGTESSLKLTLTNGSDVLSFDLPEIMYERNSPGITGPQGILIELPYRAYDQDSDKNTALEVTLTNSQETY